MSFSYIEDGEEKSLPAHLFIEKYGIVDGWNNSEIHVLVDNDGDDLIELSPSAFNEIKEALKHDYDVETINKVEDRIKVIREKVAFYVLHDESSGLKNVFSWDIEKFFDSD